MLDAFAAGVASADEELRPALIDLRDLFALGAIWRDRGWFLEEGYLEAAKSRAIRKAMARIERSVRDRAVGLVEAFGLPDEVLAAPIALGRNP